MKKVRLTRLVVTAMVMSFLIACGGNNESNENKVEKEKSSTEEFSDLADEDGFAEKHDEPKELTLDAKGKMMKVAVEGGEEANIYKRDKEGSNNYLLVFHEWWGLNNHIIMEADKWYDKLGNSNVIAIDMYDGKLATTREKAQEYMQGADEKRIKSIINGVLKTLPEGAKVGTIGWCFGGGWSLKGALLAGDRTEACVMYYGMPVKEVEKLKKLNSDALFIYGKKDQWINEEVANNFKKNMKEAGKELTVLAFDADHAFANPTSDSYVEADAQEANAKAHDYLKERLK